MLQRVALALELELLLLVDLRDLLHVHLVGLVDAFDLGLTVLLQLLVFVLPLLELA